MTVCEMAGRMLVVERRPLRRCMKCSKKDGLNYGSQAMAISSELYGGYGGETEIVVVL